MTNAGPGDGLEARMAPRRRGDGARLPGLPHRTRLDGPRGAPPGRVLRHADAPQPARRHQRAGGAPDRHPALGPERPGGHREGHPEERHRPHAQRRRDGRAPQYPAPHRGASQGPRARSSTSAWRRRAWRSATTAATRPRRSSAASVTASSARTRPARAGAAPGPHRPLDRRGRPRGQAQGAGDPGGLVVAARPADDRHAAGRAADRGRPRMSVPRHVAIIMDGNRRWARERGLAEAEGHAAGVEAIRPIVERAVERGIEVLSIYAFSRENWARPDPEVADAPRAAGLGHPRRDARAGQGGRPRPRAGPPRGAACRHAGVDRRGARGHGRGAPA